jgi:hypothetical protein
LAERKIIDETFITVATVQEFGLEVHKHLSAGWKESTLNKYYAQQISPNVFYMGFVKYEEVAPQVELPKAPTKTDIALEQLSARINIEEQAGAGREEAMKDAPKKRGPVPKVK